MGALDGRVVLITGAGRGIGREHALLMASEGAKIVVNDLGGSADGTGADQGPAGEVVAEIEAMGGEAVANGDSVTDWEGAQRMVNQAVEAFGDLHVLVNNAGILRDRVVVNMTEPEWDAVVEVHMKGHFCPTRWAAAYWREQSKAGKEVSGSVINTASGAMLGNLGQFNYSGAKAGIAAMTLVAAGELARYSVRVNCLAPIARTRLTLQTPGLEEVVRRDPGYVIVPVAGYGTPSIQPGYRDPSLDRLAASSGWAALSAVKAGRVVSVDASLFGRPGPRMGEAALYLAYRLHRGPQP